MADILDLQKPIFSRQLIENLFINPNLVELMYFNYYGELF